MQEIQIPLHQFDLEGFIADISRFLKNEVLSEGIDPLTDIPIVEQDGSIPDWGEEIPGRNIVDELINEGKKLFFPFSNVGCSEVINCASGKEIILYDDEEAEEDDDPFYLGDTDLVGYLLSVNNGILSIKAAIRYGGGCPIPPPSVEAVEDVGPFEDTMKEYIQRFIIGEKS